MKRERRQNEKSTLIFALVCFAFALASLIVLSIWFIRAHGKVVALDNPVAFFVFLFSVGFFALLGGIFLQSYFRQKQRAKELARRTCVCPSCGSRIARKSAFCPACGAKRREEE